MIIVVIIVTTFSVNVIGIGSSQSQVTMAQPPPQSQVNKTSSVLMEGISFEIDNMTFSHHMASVNGIQMHYVIGGQGDPVVLLHGWPQTWYEWRMLCQLWLKIILL